MMDDAACVLIVDDEEDVRESLRDVVELVGCHAMLAASAETALALLADHRPCLILIDVLMPGMTGLEMLDVIRADPRLSTVRVVVSTSVPERVPRGIAVLPKPIDVNALCALIKQCCACGGG